MRKLWTVVEDDRCQLLKKERASRLRLSWRVRASTTSDLSGNTKADGFEIRPSGKTQEHQNL
jgi:hypothetical protein